MPVSGTISCHKLKGENQQLMVSTRNTFVVFLAFFICCLLVACGMSNTKPSSNGVPVLILTLATNPQSTSTNPGHVIAYNSMNGHQLWSDAVAVGEYADLRTTLNEAYLATGGRIDAFALTTGKQLWSYQSPDATTSFHGFDAVTGTTLYATSVTSPPTGGNAEYLAAFDAATGQQRWSLHTASDVRLAATTQTTYFVAGGGSSDETSTGLSSALRAVSAMGDGTPLWTNANISGAAHLLLTGSVLYLNDDTGVMAIDAATGMTKWEFKNPQLDPNSYSGSLALAGTTLIASFNGQQIVGIASSNGNQLWQQTYATAQDFATDAVVCQPGTQIGLQYSANNAASVAFKAYDVATGQLAWTLSDKQPNLDETADLACDDSVLYVSEASHIIALQMRDGATLWQDSRDQIVLRSETTPWNGLVLANTVAGLLALDAHTGTMRWQAPVSESLEIISVEGEGITQN